MAGEEFFAYKQQQDERSNRNMSDLKVPLPPTRESQPYNWSNNDDTEPVEDYDSSDISEINEDGEWERQNNDKSYDDDNNDIYEIDQETPEFEERGDEAYDDYNEYDGSSNRMQSEFHDDNRLDPEMHKEHFSIPSMSDAKTTIPSRKGASITTPLPKSKLEDVNIAREERELVKEAREAKRKLESRRDDNRRHDGNDIRDSMRQFGVNANEAARQNPIINGNPFGDFGAGGIAGGAASGMGSTIGVDNNYDVLGINNMGGGGNVIGGQYAINNEDPIFGNMMFANQNQNANDFLGIGGGSMNPMDISSYIGGMGFGGKGKKSGGTMEFGSSMDLVFGSGGMGGGQHGQAFDDDLASRIANYDPMGAIFGPPRESSPPHTKARKRPGVRPAKPQKPKTKSSGKGVKKQPKNSPTNPRRQPVLTKTKESVKTKQIASPKALVISPKKK